MYSKELGRGGNVVWWGVLSGGRWCRGVEDDDDEERVGGDG